MNFCGFVIFFLNCSDEPNEVEYNKGFKSNSANGSVEVSARTNACISLIIIYLKARE